MDNVTFNGYHLPTLAKLARELNSPREGELAAFIWQLSNRPTVPPSIASDFMKLAGYVPFMGYPLVRNKS